MFISINSVTLNNGRFTALIVKCNSLIAIFVNVFKIISYTKIHECTR